MATPHIMPLGFIHRRTEAGAIIMLNNPEEGFRQGVAQAMSDGILTRQ